MKHSFAEYYTPPYVFLLFKNNIIYLTIVTIIVTVEVPLDVQIIRMTS